MDEQCVRRGGGGGGRKTREALSAKAQSLPHHNDSRIIFALMLATLRSATNNHTNHKRKRNNRKAHKLDSHHELHLQLLNQMRRSLLSEIPNPNCTSQYPIITPQLTLPAPIICLFPILLASECSKVVRKCAELIGAASLFSLAMNEQIANDQGIVKSLISALASSKTGSTSIAACNALLDLSTTSIGRQRLLDFSALEYLIFCFLQVRKSSAASVYLFIEESENRATFRMGFNEDEFLVLLLDTILTLINAYKTEQIQKIPRKLSETLLAYLKSLWAKVRAEILLGTINCSERGDFYISNIRTNNLAESIFRLSMNAGSDTIPFHRDACIRSIFSRDNISFEHFILNYWEVSPLLIGRSSRASNEQENIFSSLRHSFNFEKAVASFLSRILQNLLSCPPIASDEFDIVSFLEEVRDHLGCPMIYQQDIRVLKAQNSQKEMHFFSEQCFQNPQFLCSDDILRCEQAYKEGYTIALRGMEFRFGCTAAITDELASLFGQPSAGVNMYLTPPNSQGLARHYDDHCVLVCQLFGVKQWTVFNPPSLQLPRLYEPVDSLCKSEVDERKHFLLREGDILYIPRGFPHEACTVLSNDRTDGTDECSLHLTLAIEVEPPFEWEGFAHVALNNWYKIEIKKSSASSCDSLSQSLRTVSLTLLHVAIILIGNADPAFRKACLVGALSSSCLDDKAGLALNQRTVFDHLIKCIDGKSSFSDAVRKVTMSLEANQDPLRPLRWLQHLEEENEKNVEAWKWRDPSAVESHEVFPMICEEHKKKAEAEFVEMKSKFCREIAMEDVVESYNKLLHKYRKVRKQYLNGMLSLHCN
ncbi:[Histone H3]-lysine-36 demethylase [Bertholletia excelsa]